MDGRPLTQAELYDELIAKNTGRNDEFKHRNRLLIALAALVGLREMELTLITINLFVAPTGELKEFVILPETITKDGYERPIVLSHPEVKKAFENYLAWMIEHKINCYPHKHYYGLDPNAQLFVDDKLKPFTVQSRGETVSANAMNKQLDRLIKSTALWDFGVRRISLVRTCVIEAYRAGMSTTDIMITVGFGEETISKILTMDYQQYSPIVAWFEQRRDRKAKRLESFKKRRRFML